MTKRMVQGLGQSAESILKQEAWFVETALPEIHRQYRLGQLSPDQVKAFISHQHPFSVPSWVLNRVADVSNRLEIFFGKRYNLALLQDTLLRCGKERVEEWERLELGITYLPLETMSQQAEFPGCKVKPKGWFYDQFRAKQLYRLASVGELAVDMAADKLLGQVVLFDTRGKPPFNGGNQMWQQDDELLGGTIETLRAQGAIQRYEYGPQSSRFGISVEPGGDWEAHVKSALATHLGLHTNQVRLERAIEFNALSQMYADLPRGQDGATSTWLWFEEFFVDAAQRLHGGHADSDGLAFVSWNGSANHWDSISLRPLAVLASESRPVGSF